MKLRSLDLNLLLVFTAVFDERSISRAAVRLNLSQPTVSNSLARLRLQLGDPLFERSAQGMAPTARAKALIGPIRQALDTLERGLHSDGEFDYGHAERQFVVAVEDYGESVILPRIIDQVVKTAPGVRIKILPETRAGVGEAMRDGPVDLALDFFVPRVAGFQSECVLTDTLLTLSRRDHPGVSERLSLDAYLAASHVALSPRAGTRPMIDLALAKRGLRRHIAVEVPHFLSMPVMVHSTDMLGTMPRRMAQLYADHFNLRSHPVPLRLPSFPVYLIWHESAHNDAGHRWLREQIISFCQRL